MPGYGNRPKRPLQAGRSLPQGPRSRKRADGPSDDENGPNRRGKREAACMGINWGRFGSRFRRQIPAAASWEPAVSIKIRKSPAPCAVLAKAQGGIGDCTIRKRNTICSDNSGLRRDAFETGPRWRMTATKPKAGHVTRRRRMQGETG